MSSPIADPRPAAAHAGAARAPTAFDAPHASPDGLFDDHAMIRRLHRERAVMLHGARSLLMQGAHPLAFRGFWSTTKAQDPADAWPRLRRTGEAMVTMIFGSAADAERTGEMVRGIHAATSGVLSEPAGPWPVGTRWGAGDPELVLWILAALVDSVMTVHDRFVRVLRPEEREAFWRDYRIVGRLLGLEESDMPRTVAALDAYIAEMLASDRTEVMPEAREAAWSIVLDPPVPLALRPAIAVMNEVTASLLPTKVRRGFGLRWDPGRDLAVRAVGGWTRRVVRPLVPTSLAWTPHGSPAPVVG